METNVGLRDRLMRLVLASVLFYLGLFPYSGSAWGIGLVIAGGLFLFSAIVGFCGFYRLLGIRTHSTNVPL